MGLEKKETLSLLMTIILIAIIVGLIYTNAIKSSDVSSAVSYTLVAGVVSVLVWGFRSRIKSTNENLPQRSGSETLVSKKRENQTEDNPTKLRHKTMRLRVDHYDELKLALKREERITGKINADGFFNIYFLTESSYRSFRNDLPFKHIDGGEEVSHFQVDFVASRKGIYYIVIENADKKNIVAEMELYI